MSSAAKRVLPLVGVGVVFVAAGVAMWWAADQRRRHPPEPDSVVTTAVTPPTLIRYAARPTVYVYESVSRGPDARRALRIGDMVSVSNEVYSGTSGESYREVWESGAVLGFVLQSEITVDPPTAAELTAQAKSALETGELSEALAQAEAASVLAPALTEPWAIQAAVHGARGDFAALRSIDAGTPANIKERSPLTFNAPAAKARGYVAVPAVDIRATPAPRAAVLRSIRMNAEVDVLSISAGVAKVSWTPNHSEVVLGSKERTFQFEPVTGFVDLSALSAEALTLGDLKAIGDAAAKRYDATSAEATKDALTAARAYEGANLFAPGDSVLLKKVSKWATRAGLYPLAASAAFNAQTASDTAAAGVTSLELFFGCEVKPESAPSQCVAAIDTAGECPPCPPSASAYPATDADDYTDQVRKIDHAHAEALRAHTKAVKALKAKNDALRKKYPDGAFLHATVQGDKKLFAARKKLFVFSLPFHLGGSCGESSSQVDYSRMVLEQAATRWPDEQQSVELWAPVGYQETLSGVVAANDETEARKLIEFEPYSSGAPDLTKLPHPSAGVKVRSVAGPYKRCMCCDESLAAQ